MSIDFRSDSSALHDHQLKSERVVFQVTVTANATPASKGHASDIPGVAVLRTQGKTSEADAIEDLSGTFTTAADATGIFGVLLDESYSKLYSASVSASSGTVSVAASGLSSGGRPYLDLDSSLDFSSAGATFTVTLDCKK